MRRSHSLFNDVIVLVFILAFSIAASAQNTSRKILNIPDILGYKTLKCDFHMHTVFSDGTVWPSYRVEEAWMEGLDVIAITDHLGHHPKNKVDADNFNRNYEIAKSIADRYGIIVIHGSEITTHNSNYGHLNALFLKDVNLIDKGNPLEDIKAAAAQGAFITWNHPGWKMENEIPVWNKEQEDLLQNGLLNGIEIVNFNSYYPLAFKWAIEKQLTPMSGSDIHDPANAEFDYAEGNHRPITLVFAKDTSIAAIKDALLHHRTLVYFNNEILGNQELLKALFKASVVIQNTGFSIDADSDDKYFNYIQIRNNSGVDFDLELVDSDKSLRVTDHLLLKANSVGIINVRPTPRDLKGDKEYIFKYKVKNLLQAPEESIIIDIPVKIKFI